MPPPNASARRSRDCGSPALDYENVLEVTAGVDVGASSAADKDELIAETDVALYVAKRSGKNRTVQAGAPTTNVVGAGAAFGHRPA